VLKDINVVSQDVGQAGNFWTLPRTTYEKELHQSSSKKIMVVKWFVKLFLFPAATSQMYKTFMTTHESWFNVRTVHY
jgi:hypothetical protein